MNATHPTSSTVNSLPPRRGVGIAATHRDTRGSAWTSRLIAWVSHQQRERVNRKMALLTLDYPELARELAATGGREAAGSRSQDRSGTAPNSTDKS